MAVSHDGHVCTVRLSGDGHLEKIIRNSFNLVLWRLQTLDPFFSVYDNSVVAATQALSERLESAILIRVHFNKK